MVAGLTSCKKNGDLPPSVKNTTVNVINADSSALNFYQNGTRLNNISSLSPGSNTGYFYLPLNLPLTPEIYQVKKAGNPNYLIDNCKLTLDTSAYYSIFIAGETADKIFAITDGGSTGTLLSQAAVRFVNASPATTGLTVSLRDSLTFSGKAFKYASGFTNIGQGIATVKVYLPGSGTPIFTQSVTLTPGVLYTLFTKGIPGGTGNNALSAILITNN